MPLPAPPTPVISGPIFGQGNTSFVSSSITGVYGLVIDWIFVLMGLVALITIVLSGIKMITSGGDAKKMAEARQGLINAIIGLAIYIAIFAIMNLGLALGKAINNPAVSGIPSPEVSENTAP